MNQKQQLRELKQEHQALENSQAIQRVREIHKPYVTSGMACSCCDLSQECVECDNIYPCDTIRALDGQQ